MVASAELVLRHAHHEDDYSLQSLIDGGLPASPLRGGRQRGALVEKVDEFLSLRIGDGDREETPEEMIDDFGRVLELEPGKRGNKIHSA
mgnify:CR=1 FL=1